MMKPVCIQGLGFVGAAMAVALSSVRTDEGEPVFDVTGVDLPTAAGRQRIDALNDGRFPFETTDEALRAAATQAATAGNLRATDDPTAFGDADIIVVDVNLDVDRSDDEPRVDFGPLQDAIRAIGENMRPSALVIVETTVPPGTCDKIVIPALQDALGRRDCDRDDFLLAHSYERVMPGTDYLQSITHYWRVYAGLTPAAAAACGAFLEQLIDTKTYPLTRLDTLIASETAKIMENSYRATNIAFIEEWARFAEAVGIDLFQVIDAIRLRPTHNNIRQPGFGVGGYCLTKDPLLAGIAARDLIGRRDLAFPFSESAVRTNEAMPLVSLDRLEGMLGGNLTGKCVLIMGITYRQDVSDTRYSPSEAFARAARQRGAEVVAHDPLVEHWEELDMDVNTELPPAETVDGVVFAVPHGSYRDLDLGEWLNGTRPVVLDSNNVLTSTQRDAVIDAGCTYASIGRGEA
jgi:UDP-N-acetyl-D-glucosamine dehydrogenase